MAKKMAAVKQRTPRAKKKAPRATRRLTGFAAMPRDDLDKAKHYVQFEIENREYSKVLKEYMKKFYSKTDYAAAMLLPEWKFTYASHWATYAYWMTEGLELEEYAKAALEKYCGTLVVEGKKVQEKKKSEEKTKSASPVVTIQDRLFEKAQEVCEDIDEWLDGFIRDPDKFDPAGFDFTAHFTKHEVTQAHARKIMSFYQGEIEEAKLVLNMPTAAAVAKIKDPKEKDLAEQLREGYAHRTKKQSQTWLDALTALVSACDHSINKSKAVRKPRVKKPVSKEKIVAKVKYCVSDDKYKLVSMKPIDILDSKEVWVFNNKTRKLGRYIAAADAGVLGIKGSAIIGFDETLSIQKTLRKPEETLKEFKAASKIKLKKFLDEIKTTDTKLNGRLNEETLILKVVS
jgi:hypothetical protein